MTREEVKDLLIRNKALYPNARFAENDFELETLLDVWCWQLKDFSSLEVKRAFLAANRECTYAIQIADIFRHLPITENPRNDWGKFMQALPAIRKYDYRRSFPEIVGVDSNGKPKKDNGEKGLAEEFNKLPCPIRTWLGGVPALRELSKRLDTDLKYDMAEFLRWCERRNVHDIPKNIVAAIPAPAPTKELEADKGSSQEQETIDLNSGFEELKGKLKNGVKRTSEIL